MMDSKTIKRIACKVNRIPIGAFDNTVLIQSMFARILTCRRLFEMGIAPYDIGKILGIESHKASMYLDAYDKRMTTDTFFQAINRNFHTKIDEYENTRRNGNNG